MARGSQETGSGAVGRGSVADHWQTGAIAGLLAAIVFGAVVADTGAMAAVAAMFGVDSHGLGWVFHLGFGAAFGAGYSAVASTARGSAWADRPASGGVVGLAYGFVLWVVGAVLVAPLWLRVRSVGDVAVPAIDVPVLVGHLVYGLVLGVLYPVLVELEA